MLIWLKRSDILYFKIDKIDKAIKNKLDMNNDIYIINYNRNSKLKGYIE